MKGLSVFVCMWDEVAVATVKECAVSEHGYMYVWMGTLTFHSLGESMRIILLLSYKRVISVTLLAFPSVCSRPKESWKYMSLVNVLFCLILYSNSNVSRTLCGT